MTTLTKKQIQRQDFVDNAVFDMLKLINPSRKRLDWDIELIAEVRETARRVLQDKLKIREQKFYPFIKE
jgi:hypothetical protein